MNTISKIDILHKIAKQSGENFQIYFIAHKNILLTYLYQYRYKSDNQKYSKGKIRTFYFLKE